MVVLAAVGIGPPLGPLDGPSINLAPLKAVGGSAMLRCPAPVPVLDSPDGGLSLVGLSRVWRLTAVKRVWAEGVPWYARESERGVRLHAMLAMLALCAGGREPLRQIVRRAFAEFRT